MTIPRGPRERNVRKWTSGILSLRLQGCFETKKAKGFPEDFGDSKEGHSIDSQSHSRVEEEVKRLELR